MREPMTDQEIICAFMEPNRPKDGCSPLDIPLGADCPKWWFRWSRSRPPYGNWEPRELTLGALWEVEERLTDEQVGKYDAQIRRLMREDPVEPWVPAKCHYWHATPGQKIKALAAVLRPLVEKEQK